MRASSARTCSPSPSAYVRVVASMSRFEVSIWRSTDLMSGSFGPSRRSRAARLSSCVRSRSMAIELGLDVLSWRAKAGAESSRS